MKDYSSLITDKRGEPVKIALLAAHHCIRCIRIGDSLKSLGYTVYGSGSKEAYGVDLYDNYILWKNEAQFKNSVKLLIDQGVSIIEWNNEPDNPMLWAREVIDSMGKQDEVKLIYNAHDLDNIRRGFIPIEERKAFNCADAIIYVSEPIRKICNDLHSITVPSIVLYNYATKSMNNNTEVDWEKANLKKKTLVYEGGVNPIGESEEIKQMNIVFKYRNLFPIFQELLSMGNEVHAFPGNHDAFATGQNTGVVVHPPTPFDKLLQMMTQYKYNLLTFNNEDGKQNQVNYTTPNKLWDGLCAGLPSIACYCSETEKYVNKHDLGWTFNHIKDIGDCSELEEEYVHKLNNIKKKREELVFDRQIWRVENLYAQLLGLECKSVPEDIKEQAVFEYGEKDTESLLKEAIV